MSCDQLGDVDEQGSAVDQLPDTQPIDIPALLHEELR